MKSSSAERHKRYDIDDANPGVHSCVPQQGEVVNGQPSEQERIIHHTRAAERKDASMVLLVVVDIKKRSRDGAPHHPDEVEILTFADVDDALKHDARSTDPRGRQREA